MSEDEIILTHILKCSRADLLVKKPALNASQKKQYQEFLRRRKKGEPLQYILETWEFFGLEFNVNENVLIPRPETEILVQEALKLFRGTAILDLGTGSGNISITLAKRLPYVQVTAVDVSLEAIEVAMSNAQAHGVESRIEFVHMDMFDFLNEKDKAYDLIISNPPYIPTKQLKHLPLDVQKEPVLALDGGIDGLDFYRNLIKISPGLIRANGYLMMEFGDGQAEAIVALAAQEDAFVEHWVIKDLAGKNRILIFQKGR